MSHHLTLVKLVVKGVKGKDKRQSGADVPPMTEEVKEGFIEYFINWCTKKYPEKKDEEYS